MAEDDGGVPFLSSLGLSITARCPIVCPHCIVEAGPHRKEEMAIDDVREWLQQAASYRNGLIKSVVITGGEPFYNLGLLREVLNCALTHRLVPIVITNAFWAETFPVAVDILRSLPQIRMLTVSTDVYHQRFIPIGYAKNALRAAQQLGLGCNAAVCFEREDDPAYQRTVSDLQEVVSEGLIRSAATSPAGRALRKFQPGRLPTSTEWPKSACTAADYPTVFPDGKLICCMGLVTDLPPGHPLLLGNLRKQPLHVMLDRAERNVALQVLRLWGPGRLLKMLDVAGYGDRLPRAFIKSGCCDFCHELAANSQLIECLAEVTANPELIEKVAYARLYYLNEDVMLEAIGQGANTQ